jgi:hypothetical protein
MERRLTLIIIAFLMILFFMCGQKDRKPDIENTLAATLNNFPQFPKEKGELSRFYSLIRSVSIADGSIEIQLRSTPDSIDDTQKMIVVINPARKTYVIPLFSNTYRDYWSFPFDSILPSVKPVKTTFEEQLNICLNTLGLNDTLNTAGKVVEEIFRSLLQCRELDISDSTYVQSSPSNSTKSSLPDEDRASCDKRFKRNWDTIAQDFIPQEGIAYKHSFIDVSNERICQFNFKNFEYKKRNYFKIKFFRTDCNFHFLSL